MGSTTLPSAATAQGTSTIVPTAASKEITIRGIKKNAVARLAGGAATYANTIAADGPAAYYQLNDSSSILNDSGPNALSGSYGTGVTHNAAALTTGGVSAAGFAGGTAYDPTMFASVPVAANLMPATLSVEAWIQPTQLNSTGKLLPLVSFGRYVDGARYALFITQQNVAMFQLINAGLPAGQVFGTSSIAPGSAYHIVGTSNGSTISLYVNGVLQTSLAYAGAPSYNPNNPYGLYIGGAPTSNDPSFNGSIAQVAVYGSALSAAQVLNHFVAGQLAPMVNETPLISSDGFVDSIGINTHFTNYYTAYSTSYAQASAALTGLGIRHIRDGLVPPGHPLQLSQYASLGAAGIRGLFVTQLNMVQSTIQSFPSQVGNCFEAYEPPNEQDVEGNVNWASLLLAFQQNLYSWVKTNPATAQYPVLGPVLVGATAYPKVGDISSELDYANVHDYMNPYNPGTPGWGSMTAYGRYGSIAYNMNLVKVTSENKPVIATETGYGTNIPGVVDNYTLLRYMPRLFFDQINAGIVRTYSYELLDEPPATAMFQTFGLVQSDFTPKPAYTALKGIIAALSDPGPTFKPAALSYQLIGSTNQVVHTLMQKHNGSYVFAVWIETPSYWITAGVGADIIVPAQSVTLNTTKSFSSATISSLDEGGNLTTSPLNWAKTGATFNVTDKVSLITINP